MGGEPYTWRRVRTVRRQAVGNLPPQGGKAPTAEPTNHRPKDKSGHGNLVAQVGGDGEEYLPSHLVTLKQHTDERRKEHYHDGRAGQYLPADRYRCNRHDRVGNLRTVRDYRPDGSGRDKGSLQKRSFEHT